MPVPVVYKQHYLKICIDPQVLCTDILFIIYFELNAEVLQGNAAVLSILHSRKGMITSEGNFHGTKNRTVMLIWWLKQL